MESLKKRDIDLMMVDDEKDILELSEMALARKKDELNIESTTSPDEVIERTEDGLVDVILSDYNMPQMSGVELLEDVREIDENLPFILYTGEGTERIAEEAINVGVTDYFRKEAGLDHYDFILNSIENSVESYRDSERAEVLSVLVQNSNQPVVVTDASSEIVYVNQAFEEASGYSEEELLGENPNILSSGEHEEEEFKQMYEALSNGETFRFEEMTNLDKDGNLYVHDQELFPVGIHGDGPDYFAGISELKT